MITDFFFDVIVPSIFTVGGLVLLITLVLVCYIVAGSVGDEAKMKRDAYNNAPHCKSAEIHCGFE